MIKNYFKLAIVILFCCFVSYGQQINRIQSKCPSPYQLTKSQVSANSNGDILYIPCTGQSSIFSGNVDFSGATITGAVTGSGTVNYVPRWLTSTNNLANTPLSWNGTAYNFNNTALTSTFPMNLTPTSGAGVFNVGNTASAYIALGQASGLAQVKGNNGLNLDAPNGDIRFTSVSTKRFIFDGATINITQSDCISAAVTLDAAGMYDLTTTNCWASSGIPTVIVTGTTALGILRVNAGVVTSSAGAADSGNRFNYLIIDAS